MPSEGARRFKKIYIEISGSCNLRCGFCPGAGRLPRLMGPELFAAAVAGAAPIAEQAYFHILGEPLAHPRFPEYVTLCSEKGLPVNITTNGTLLADDRVQTLLDPIVRQVSFSLHSLAPDAPGQDIERYLADVFRFTRQAFRVRPDLYVNYRLWNLGAAGEGANAPIIGLVEREFGVELKRDVDVRWKKGRRVVNRLSMHFDTRFAWPSRSAPLVSSLGTCRGLGDHFGILSDGTVVPCCLDWEGAAPLGDLKSRSLDEILGGGRSQAMARGFRENRLVEDLCRRCTYISRFSAPASSREGGRS